MKNDSRGHEQSEGLSSLNALIERLSELEKKAAPGQWDKCFKHFYFDTNAGYFESGNPIICSECSK